MNDHRIQELQTPRRLQWTEATPMDDHCIRNFKPREGQGTKNYSYQFHKYHKCY